MKHKIYRTGLVLAVITYEILVISLLTNELLAANYRATDRVIILLGLLFLPGVLLLLGRTLIDSKLVNLKLPGNLEILVNNLEQKVAVTEQKTEALERQVEGKLSTAEQTLYPMIGGTDAFSAERLEENRLIIGAKDFEANIVVAELVAQHLENYGVSCERWIPNGGTSTNYACLINGWIDCFVDYTGTGCLYFNVQYRGKTVDEILAVLNRLSSERYLFEWMRPLGTNTNYCLVMAESVAEKKSIDSLSRLEFIDRGALRFCGNFEFMNRRDGLPGLKAFYNLRFSEEITCSYHERYEFVAEGKADVAVGHTTDSDIARYGLRILEDDKQFFPDYLETPLVRTEVFEKIPQLRKAFDDLAELKISNEEITVLIQDYTENKDSLAGRVQALLARK